MEIRFEKDTIVIIFLVINVFAFRILGEINCPPHELSSLLTETLKPLEQENIYCYVKNSDAQPTETQETPRPNLAISNYNITASGTATGASLPSQALASPSEEYDGFS